MNLRANLFRENKKYQGTREVLSGRETTRRSVRSISAHPTFE